MRSITPPQVRLSTLNPTLPLCSREAPYKAKFKGACAGQRLNEQKNLMETKDLTFITLDDVRFPKSQNIDTRENKNKS